MMVVSVQVLTTNVSVPRRRTDSDGWEDPHAVGRTVLLSMGTFESETMA